MRFLGSILSLIFLISILFESKAYCQVSTKGGAVENVSSSREQGKIYALIVGVSEYEYPETYKTLNYADDDGRMFYNFLTSVAGGSVPKDNIDTLFNEKATHGSILESMLNLKERLEPNDIFYFYFSGHGDAYNAEKAFLLAYDSPSNKGKREKNHYLTGTGAIDIHTIKTIFKEITYTGTTVVFVSDACRTNELAGGLEGQSSIFKKIMEEDAGEVRLTSCSSNQVSFEGPQWGEGRGLFSYHLVNGLIGMADNEPQDDKVTMDELFSYIKSNVKRATYDTLQGLSLQVPQFSCRKENCESIVINKVNKAERDRLAISLKSDDNNYSNLYAYTASKGTNVLFEMKQIGKEELYTRFYTAIRDKNLIGKSGASEIFTEIEEDTEIPERLKNEFRGALSNSLLTDVNKVINTYMNASQNNNLYTHDFFRDGYLKLKKFKEIANPLFYNDIDVKVNLLFLEGHSNWKSTKTIDLLYSLSKIDSAVALKPEAAYLYNIKGLLHLKLKQFDTAHQTFSKGVELAPNWIYPLHNIGAVYSWVGEHDSSLLYYFKALDLDTTYQVTYLEIAREFYSIDKVDSCYKYLDRAIEADPKDPYIWSFQGDLYYKNEDYKKAKEAYRKSFTFDSTLIIGYEGALRLHLKSDQNIDSLMYYQQKMLDLDPSNPSVYLRVGYIFLEFDMPALDSLAASVYFTAAVNFDTLNVEAWNALAYAHSKLGNDKYAAQLLNKSISIDSLYAPTFSQYGVLLFNNDLVDMALTAFLKAIKLNPYQEFYYYNAGYMYFQQGEFNKAQEYYEECVRRNPYYTTIYTDLAELYALQGNLPKTIEWTKKSVSSNLYTSKKELLEIPAFSEIKKDKAFKKMLKSLTFQL